MVSLGVVDGEERFDAVTDPHPHLVCGRCGRVLDLPGADLPDILGGKFKILPEYFGFVIDLRKTIFYGFCKDCMANETCMTGRTCSADQAGPANRTCRAGKSSAANREGETTENGGPGPL